MNVYNWSESYLNFTWVVNNQSLSGESFCKFSWIITWVRDNVTFLDFLIRNITYTETNVVSWLCYWDLFLMHFNTFAKSIFVVSSNTDINTWFKSTIFDFTSWYNSNSLDFINISDRDSQWSIRRSLWRFDLIKDLVENWSFIPRHILRSFCEILSIVTRNWDKCDVLLLKSDFGY